MGNTRVSIKLNCNLSTAPDVLEFIRPVNPIMGTSHVLGRYRAVPPFRSVVGSRLDVQFFLGFFEQDLWGVRGEEGSA